MSILVAGAGAIGLWLASRLDADVLCRPHHAKVITSTGLTVTGHTSFQGRLALMDPDRTYDLVILTCKAHQTAALARDMAGRAGVLASMQNGLGNAEKLAVVHDRTAIALTSHGVTVKSPGHVHHAGLGSTQVGGEAADVLMEALSAAGLEPQRVEDIKSALWQKAIVNAGINPVAALADVPNGRLLEAPLWDDVVGLVDEAYALSRAAGVRVPATMVETTRAVLERTRDNTCSMLQDVRAKRPTEIEQINGAFVRTSRRLGYPTPKNDEAYRAVKGLEAGYLGEKAALALTKAELGTA